MNKKRVIDYLNEIQADYYPDDYEDYFQSEDDEQLELDIKDYGTCQGSDWDYDWRDDDDEWDWEDDYFIDAEESWFDDDDDDYIDEDEWYFGYPDDDGIIETEEDSYDDGADIEDWRDEE